MKGSPGIEPETLVFFDCEATGLSDSKVTEVSLVAVHKDEFSQYVKTLKKFLQGKSDKELRPPLPRVLNKLTLAIYPKKLIMPRIEVLTGLSNYNLEKQSAFNSDVVDTLSRFLRLLAGPVCLVAHNGNKFDFPILKQEILSAKCDRNFPENLLCCDTYPFLQKFYSKPEHPAASVTGSPQPETPVPLAPARGVPSPVTPACGVSPSPVTSACGVPSPVPPTQTLPSESSFSSRPRPEFVENSKEDVPSPSPASHLTLTPEKNPSLLPAVPCTPVKLTPQASPFLTPPHSERKRGKNLTEELSDVTPAKKMAGATTGGACVEPDLYYLPLQQNPPRLSLEKTYHHLFGLPPAACHGAEMDCLSLLQIAAVYGSSFIEWTRDTAVLFAENMATASACFKWVDLLETQFDKSWVDLEAAINQLEDDEDDNVVQTSCRKHAASLASCFSQLAHKATVVFQNNAKLEAELLHLREELAHSRQTAEQVTAEKEYLTLVLQSTLLENHKLKHPSPVETIQEVASTPSLAARTAGRSSSSASDSRPNPYLSESLLAENTDLRREILELESELIGARLDNVYLDKELAGRIQQIQLLASNTNPEVKERMWGQIESEMCLQRAKTIAKICKTKQELKVKNACVVSPAPAPPLTNGHTKQDSIDENIHHRGKQVMVLKNPADDLGMAIIGGKEHSLPIIVSEVFPNSAVARANKLRAGDIILSVNGQEFSNFSHQEAVNYLSVLRGQIVMDLQSAENMSEDDPSNLDFRFYQIFHPRQTSCTEGEADLPTSPRSHPGKAVPTPEPGRALDSPRSTGGPGTPHSTVGGPGTPRSSVGGPGTPRSSVGGPGTPQGGGLPLTDELPPIHSPTTSPKK